MFLESSSGSKEKIKFQDLGRLHAKIQNELQEAFEKVLSTSAFIQGPCVVEFEKQFAEYTKAPYCLGVSNGTDALEIALEVLGIGPGDIVALPSMTFAATGEAIVRRGAKPLFVDSNPKTLCATPKTLLAALEKSSKPIKAFIAVHLYGLACDMPGFKNLANQHRFSIIEDCAQAHGARISGQHVGTFGEIGTFSFYPGKNLGALGDAGAIVTTSKDLHEKMRLLRDHGRTQKYLHEHIGRNSRLDGLQAAFLSVKLRHLDAWTEQRRKLAETYQAELKGITGVELLALPSDKQSHVYHLLVLKMLKNGPSRDKLMAWLSERGIESGIHYPLGLHMQPAFKAYGPFGELGVTEQATRQILSLPMDPLMSETEVKRVCHEIRAFVNF